MSDLKPGVIIGCYTTKMLDEPSLEANVICELTTFTDIMIDESLSTDEFYNVCTSSGIEGYCRRDQIMLKQL